MSINRYVEWFENYARGFVFDNPEDNYNLGLKRIHTFRVLDYAGRIAGSLDTDEDTKEAVFLAALFHDVGRFSQYERFRTFRDDFSVNHAAQGVRVLKRENVLKDLSAQKRKRILTGIALHNKRRLKQIPDGKTALVAGIVRDADKLDIFEVMLTHFNPGGGKLNKAVTLELEPHPTAFTQKFVDCIFDKTLGDYKEMVWVNDFILVLLSWIYDFNFNYTLRVLIEKGHIEKIMGFLPEDRELNRVKTEIRSYLAGIR